MSSPFMAAQKHGSEGAVASPSAARRLQSPAPRVAKGLPLPGPASPTQQHSAAACDTCGNIFAPDSSFCRKCGTQRGTAAVNGEATFPQRQLPHPSQGQETRGSDRGGVASLIESVTSSQPCCFILGLLMLVFLLRSCLFSSEDVAQTIDVEGSSIGESATIVESTSKAESTSLGRMPFVAQPIGGDCEISGDRYLASTACSDVVRNEWSRLARVSRQDGACRIEYATGEILCDTSMQCEGGTTQFVENIQNKHLMEYDCSKCPDIQRHSCCSKCAELRQMALRQRLTIKNTPIDEVSCWHCEDREMEILPRHEVSCTLNQTDGKFKCGLFENCQEGVQRIETQNLSYTCTVTPCDACADVAAKAQCCTMCLENYCKSHLDFKTRKICRGCAKEIPRE